MSILPSLPYTLDALAYASAIGLLSMGLSLTYATTKVPNFAQASIAMFGAVTLLLLIDRYYYYHPGWSVFLAGVVLGGLVTGAVAWLVYVTVLKPLADRGNTVIGLMIATFALDIIFVNVLTAYLDEAHGVHIPKLIGASITSFEPRLHIGDYIVYGYTIALPITAVVLTVIFHLFLTRTKFGVAMRATIENPDLASVLGVNVNLVYMVSWFLSGFLAGAAGALMAYTLKGVDPSAAELIIVTVFAGSIVGGLESVYWGLIGGFIVGLAEKLGMTLLNNFYRDYFVLKWHAPNVSLLNYEKFMSLGLVVVMLLYAPRGLAGIDWGAVARRLGLRRGGGGR
ncbi:MAG: branched-chain amino acid ABC transporter permease [Desulfurococcales archaeon]|nr:branched-chain amino acid ABC transporter permease [Desulfurococcales archaeon]